jgi:hypothetical protein
VSKLEPSRALVAAENTFKQQHHCCRFFPCKGFVEGLPKGTNEYCCCIFVVTKQEKKIDVTSNNSSWGTEELFIYWILSIPKAHLTGKGQKLTSHHIFRGCIAICSHHPSGNMRLISFRSILG